MPFIWLKSWTQVGFWTCCGWQLPHAQLTSGVICHSYCHLLRFCTFVLCGTGVKSRASSILAKAFLFFCFFFPWDKDLTHVAPQGILELSCLSVQVLGCQIWQDATTAFVLRETGLSVQPQRSSNVIFITPTSYLIRKSVGGDSYLKENAMWLLTRLMDIVFQSSCVSGEYWTSVWFSVSLLLFFKHCNLGWVVINNNI